MVLPPSLLYPRVRAVFQLYGNMVDAKTSVPLFNKTNWGRANNVLKEILAGHASDPPGVSFYQQRLNAKGEPVKAPCRVTINQMKKKLGHASEFIKNKRGKGYYWAA